MCRGQLDGKGRDPYDVSMSPDQDERSVPQRVWLRAGTVVLVVVLSAGLIAVGLVLTGIIAEPETVIEAILRALIPG